MGRRNSRRDFLKQSSMAGFGFWVAGGLASADVKKVTAADPDVKKVGAADRVNIACIGVGGIPAAVNCAGQRAVAPGRSPRHATNFRGRKLAAGQ